MRARPLSRRPTVTIVIPCHNYGRYLPAAVASVLTQPDVDVEAIVIDDASTDGSQEVVQRLADSDERVHAIIHDANRGHIATYNEGLEQARGDYLVLLSADDLLTPGALARATALLDANPNVGFVYGFPLTFEGQPPPAPLRVRDWTVWPGLDWIDRCCRTGRNPTATPEVVMRTSVQHAIGGYDPALPVSGDFEMWLRAASVSDVGRVNGPAQAYYRSHSNNMHLTRYAGWIVDLEARLAAFEKVLTGPGAHPGGVELLACAHRALAGAALGYARIAYDHGLDGVEPVDEYLAFAERVWPAARDTKAWRTCERRAAAPPALSARGTAAKMRRTIEHVNRSLRWYRWRWSGQW